MKPWTLLTAAAFAAFLLFTGTLAFTSCIGTRTKDVVQMEAAQQVWPRVRADVERGIDAGLDESDLQLDDADALVALADALGAALAAGSRDDLRLVPWSQTLRPWADAGIEDRLTDGEIGPTVALELAERVDNFTATIESLQEAR